MRFQPTWLAIASTAPHRRENVPATDIRLRDVMLVGVLPTAATLAVAMVILVERLQVDPSAPSTIDSMTPSRIWFACVLLFALTHMVGCWVAWRTDLAGWLLRLAFLPLFLAASFWPGFGGVFTHLMFLQTMVLIALYVLIFPMMLIPFVAQIPSYLFGMLLALGAIAAPRQLSWTSLWRSTVVYGLACSVAGPLVVWGMLFLDARQGADTIPLAHAALVAALWAVACSIVWASSLEARESGSLRALLRTGALRRPGAVLIAFTATCAMSVAAMVDRRVTIFSSSDSTWPRQLIDAVRGGRPLLDLPFIHADRTFSGPFIAKRRGSGRDIVEVDLRLPDWVVNGSVPPVTLRLNRKRYMQLLTCPELTAPIVRCRTIKPPWNEPLLQVTVPRQVYFVLEGEYEFAPAVPNVGLWRTKHAGGATRCWLNLEDWPTPGDAVRAEADCIAPWLEQAARLRTLLEARLGQ